MVRFIDLRVDLTRPPPQGVTAESYHLVQGSYAPSYSVFSGAMTSPVNIATVDNYVSPQQMLPSGEICYQAAQMTWSLSRGGPSFILTALLLAYSAHSIGGSGGSMLPAVQPPNPALRGACYGAASRNSHPARAPCTQRGAAGYAHTSQVCRWRSRGRPRTLSTAMAADSS